MKEREGEELSLSFFACALLNGTEIWLISSILTPVPQKISHHINNRKLQLERTDSFGHK